MSWFVSLSLAAKVFLRQLSFTDVDSERFTIASGQEEEQMPPSCLAGAPKEAEPLLHL